MQIKKHKKEKKHGLNLNYFCRRIILNIYPQEGIIRNQMGRTRDVSGLMRKIERDTKHLKSLLAGTMIRFI